MFYSYHAAKMFRFTLGWEILGELTYLSYSQLLSQRESSKKQMNFAVSVLKISHVLCMLTPKYINTGGLFDLWSVD